MRKSLTAILVLGLAAAAFAGKGEPELDLSWYTVDCGGAMFTFTEDKSGLELSGTIGQHDASLTAMTAEGPLLLRGGFWVAALPRCNINGDLDGDTTLTPADIPGFVDCLIAAPSAMRCTCADMDLNGVVNGQDIQLFVDVLY
jgi:hypothetical protein